MEQGESAGSGSGGADGDSARQEAVDNLTAAMARLRGAIDRLRQEVEANAQAEWVRAKPELRSTIGELEGMVDALSQRAKAALAGLGSRLNEERGEDKPQS